MPGPAIPILIAAYAAKAAAGVYVHRKAKQHPEGYTGMRKDFTNSVRDKAGKVRTFFRGNDLVETKDKEPKPPAPEDDGSPAP